MSPAVAAVIALYAVFLAVGWAAARKVRAGTAADLIVAGRAMPLWVATLTMTATWVDGGYLLGTAEGVYSSSIQLGLQGGLCFGLSLVIGGRFFARRMRLAGWTTLIDPLDARFGTHWAAVLFLPALAGELFWSAELLVALGATFGVLLDMPIVTAILLAAVVTTAYTMVGGMWSVAYTDVVQLALVAVGLALALPYVLEAAGGLGAAWQAYVSARPESAAVLPPLAPRTPAWQGGAVLTWWDTTIMLVLGGVPWNSCFQRVLSCRTPDDAAAHSTYAGLLTMALTIPPLLMGLGAFAYPWSAEALARLQATPADALPLLFAQAVPPGVSVLGLAAIVGAVTSSFSASILSAGSMLTWNCLARLVWPALSLAGMRRAIRGSILGFGVVAFGLAMKVQSVQALWFFTSDLVFVLLFPQLVSAVFDPKANRIGSMAAFGVSALLRLSGGEPLLGLPALVAYPEGWPLRAVAAGAGLVLLPLVSRLTGAIDPPRPLTPGDGAGASIVSDRNTVSVSSTRS
ncbi:MAG: sodium:solute symporter family protein [Vicinamibacterales bacterium]